MPQGAAADRPQPTVGRPFSLMRKPCKQTSKLPNFHCSAGRCFVPLIAAISAVLAASYAEEVSAGTLAFEVIFPQVILILLVDAALFAGPLLIFAPKLWRCRLKGLNDYMAFSARYVRAFDLKWLRSGEGSGDELLGTADIQSLADLSNSIEIVRNMRWVPVSYRLLASFTAAAILPMLPLLLLKYPIDELARRILQMLVGT